MFYSVMFELKKIIRNRFLWGLLFFFFIADAYVFYNGRSLALNTMDEGEAKIYSIISGDINEEKISFVTDNYKKYTEIIQSGNYSEDGGQPGTFTGYIMGDYNFFQYDYELLREKINYKKYAGKICDKAVDNARFLDKKGNDFGVKKNSLIYTTFKDRSIDEFYYNGEAEQLFSADYSTLFMFLIIVVGFGGSLLLEKDNNMYPIMETVPYSSRKKTVAKLIAMLLFSLFVVITFVVLDYVLLCIEFRPVDNWTGPVYSLPGYGNSPLNCSIFQFYIMLTLSRYTAIVFFSLIVYLMYLISLDGIKTIVYSITLFCVCAVMCISHNYYFNPTALFNLETLVKRCDIVSIFGFPMFYYEVVLISAVVINIILMTCFIMISEKSIVIRLTKRAGGYGIWHYFVRKLRKA